MIQPHELPVTPKRWIVTTSKASRHAGNEPHHVLAAVMPWPALTGHEPCADDKRFISDKDKMSTIERVMEERELRELCEACPVLTVCREWAIAHDKYNFAGGLSAQDREAARLNRSQMYVELHNLAVHGLDDNDLFTSNRRCKHGHEVSYNTAHYRQTKNGKLEPVCTVCYDTAQDAAFAARARNRKAS